VGVVAVGANRTRSINEPEDPTVPAKKISVPIVPPPCELLLAAVTLTDDILGVAAKLGVDAITRNPHSRM
jgi:hypothetical protein